MNRRSFVTTTAAGAGALAFPAVLRAQSKDPIRIGVPSRSPAPSPRSPPTCSAGGSSPRPS